MPDLNEERLCANCNRSGKLVCSCCKSIHYCSKSCQKLDWATHKLICKVYKEFLLTTPEPNYHSAIYFHPDEPHPRFIWVPFCGGGHAQLDTLTHLGIGEARLEEGVTQLKDSVMLDRHIEPHHILIYGFLAEDACPCCTSFEGPNKSLLAIDSEVANFYRGPVLATATHCGANLSPEPSDLDLTPLSFRYVVEGLRKVYCQNEDDLRLMLVKDNQRVPAVRINCKGDSVFLTRPVFESVEESRDILATAADIPTPVADKIGLPLAVRQIPPAVLWRNCRKMNPLENHKASMLNPPGQSSNSGSLIVARKDGKPLLSMHLMALNFYTAEKLKKPSHPHMACLTAQDLDIGRLDQVSKEDFEDWYATTWPKLPGGDGSIPSPFDITCDFKGPWADVHFAF